MKIDPQDLIQKRFGDLTVISYLKHEGKDFYYECKCDCGNRKITTRNYLKRGWVKSCGCKKYSGFKVNHVIKDITNKKYGRLTVISLAETKKGKAYWLCECLCGKKAVVLGRDLTTGKTKSCGCYHSECSSKRATKHGGCNTRLYKTWENMKNRCDSPKSTDYKYYGERGISYCEDWADYTKFREWALKTGYTNELTIERIDVNKGYCPENCTWIPKSKQNLNKNNNRLFTYNGKTQCLNEWIRELGLSSRGYVNNCLRKGIPFEKIVEQSL